MKGPGRGQLLPAGPEKQGAPMSKFHLPRCPYCGKKGQSVFKLVPQVSGGSTAVQCGGISNVVLDSAAYIVAGAAVLVALVLFAVYLAAQHTIGL